jgi:hypothetical protein
MQLFKPLAVALLILTGCGTSDSTDNYSTPRKAATMLAQAVQQGDAAGIKAASVGGDPQVIDALAASMSAHKALADAATAKFGPDAKGFDNDAGAMSDFAQRLNDAQVTINGETAVITINGSSTPWLTLKKIDGDWKADLSQLPGLGPSNESPAMAAMMQKMAAVTRDLAAEVAAGKYPTIDAAREARMQKIKAAIANMPSTRA